MIGLIRNRLQTTQNRQKNYVDKQRKMMEFEIGDELFLSFTNEVSVL